MEHQEHVILVHGTGASAPSDAGEAWWQRAGVLWPELAEWGFAPECFIWSGDNSERARRQAGRQLALRIRAIASEGERVHLVGHSHGGSVIAHALGTLPGSALDAVQSWTSVGTPYLRYGLRLPRLLFDALVLLGSGLVLAIALLTLRDVDIGFAWEHDKPITALWFALLALPLVAAILTGGSLLPFGLQLLRRSRINKLASRRDRHLALWSRQDEPIIGLRASGSFSLKILGGGSVSTLGAMVRPLATATNQFVNNMVSRALQGSNIAHLEMRAAASALSQELAHHPLPQDIDDELIFRANQRAAVLGLRVREILSSGRDPVTGFSDLQRSAATAFTFNELVHTTYFQSRDCINLILHHVLRHSGTSPAPGLRDSLASWYGTRFAGSTPCPDTYLPGNRMGFAVAAGVAGFATALSLNVVSLSAVHAWVLAPTTPRYHIDDLINARRLAVALGSVLPAESLEQAGSLGMQGGIYLSFGVEPDLSILHPYLESIVRANQLERLVESVFQLDTPELRTLFYAYGFPLLLGAADLDQMRWLSQSRLLPGLGNPGLFGANRVEPDFSYPVVDEFVQRAAARGMLDESLFVAAINTCPKGSLCRARAHMSAVRTLALAGTAAEHKYLFDLPAAFVNAMLAGQNGENPVSVREPLLQKWWSSDEDLPFVVWLSQLQAWDHVAIHTRHVSATSERVNFAWAEFDKAIRRGLEHPEGETLNQILSFITRIPWREQLPEDVLQTVRSLLDKQIAALDTHTPVVSKRTFDRFTAAEKSKLLCSSLVDLDSEAFESRLAEIKQEGARCPVEQRDHRRKGRAHDRFERFLEATTLFGEDGILQNMVRLQLAYLPASFAELPRKVLFDSLRKAVCKPVDEISDFDTGDLDVEELAAALRFLGKPLAQDPDVAAWATLMTSSEPCSQWASADSDAREEAVKTGRVINFQIIDWLHTADPVEALERMQKFSGTWGGPVTSVPFNGPGVDQFAAWFHSKLYSTDALYITHTAAPRFRIMRRASLFRLASCELAYGSTQRADRLASLAARSGQRIRQHAPPKDAMQAIRAEAEYFALRDDWRRSTSVCERCDARDMLRASADLIVPLSRRHLRGPAPKPSYCEDITDEAFKILIESQEQVEKHAEEEALRRAAALNRSAGPAPDSLE